jgi:hypothetical protein
VSVLMASKSSKCNFPSTSPGFYGVAWYGFWRAGFLIQRILRRWIINLTRFRVCTISSLGKLLCLSFLFSLGRVYNR